MDMLKQREQDAKSKAAFFAGQADRHPHGLSAPLPYENDKRNKDAADHTFSEWGTAAGIV